MNTVGWLQTFLEGLISFVIICFYVCRDYSNRIYEDCFSIIVNSRKVKTFVKRNFSDILLKTKLGTFYFLRILIKNIYQPVNFASKLKYPKLIANSLI